MLKSLPDSNHEKFRAALVNKETKHLEIVLCYEQSAACIGVKRHNFKVGYRLSVITQTLIFIRLE